MIEPCPAVQFRTLNESFEAGNERRVERTLLSLGVLVLGLILGPMCTAAAQDADVEGRTSSHAAALVSAIADMASRDVAGAICADSRHRRASVLSFALAGRERRLRAAISRRDAAGEREERRVIQGLLGLIRELHAEAASCVGETAPATPPESAEPTYGCVLELDADVPDESAMRMTRSDTPTSAVRE